MNARQTLRHYLVVRADGTCRLLSRHPTLGRDEIAYRLNIMLPEGWGRVGGTIDVVMPNDVPIVAIDNEEIMPTLEDVS